MLVSFQYWTKCSPMDFSKCRYSLASAKSCLLWVGSRTKYGTSTTPTTPPQALKHTNHITVNFFCVLNHSNSFSLRACYSHASLQLGPCLLVHLDETRAVVDKHPIQVPLFDVHSKYKVQLLGLLQCSDEQKRVAYWWERKGIQVFGNLFCFCSQ